MTPSGRTIDVRESQPLKAFLPTVVQWLASTEVMAVMPSKALSSIVVSAAGMVKVAVPKTGVPTSLNSDSCIFVPSWTAVISSL